MTGYVYMTASQKRSTIYIGVTNDLGRHVPQHKDGTDSRFTARYGVQRLVWYEEHFDIRDAIQWEKSLKRWPRQWKIEQLALLWQIFSVQRIFEIPKMGFR